MQSDGLGSYSVVDLARYTSLKQVNNQACPCLILSNSTNSHGEILGACRTITDLRRRIGGKFEDIPKVAELRKAGLDGIPICNNHLVLRLFLPSDIMTPEQVIADCGNDHSKKTNLDELLRWASTEYHAKRMKPLEKMRKVHGHVKIICQAMYPDTPYSKIFNLGTTEFSRKYLQGESRIFHADLAWLMGERMEPHFLEYELGKENVRVSIFMVSRHF
jgi:hypothetical protein